MSQPTISDKSVLAISNLSVTIDGGRILTDVDLNLEAEQTLALVGESGSGKSMTALSCMRLLPDVARVANGDILLNGDDGVLDLLSLTERQMRSVRGRALGMIFQEPMTALNPVFNVAAQLFESIRCNTDCSDKAVYRQAVEWLERVGLKEHNLKQYPHELSGGMRQRVMIACALAAKPKVLIADEPTTALDVTVQAQVLDLIKDLQQDLGMAVLFISHDLGVVSQVADSVAVMKQGDVVETASSQALFKHPKHVYTQQLFSVLPSLEKRGQPLSQFKEEGIEQMVCSNSKTTVMTVKNLSLSYDKLGLWSRLRGKTRQAVVSNVSFDLKAGQTLALVGESGSGKSTVARALLKLLQPMDGRIDYQGNDITQFDAARTKQYRSDVQIVFQDPFSSMNPRMTIGRILEEGMKRLLPHLSAEGRLARSKSLLSQVGLSEDMLQRYPHEFSGGQRQRIAIARALAVEPKVLILDEPTSALDVSVQAQILDLLNALQNQLGLSYLFITHNMSVVSYFADEVMVMQSGQVMESNEAVELMTNPQAAYTQNLLAAVPQRPH